MKVLTCLLLLRIYFGHTHSIQLVHKPDETNQRSVNLALETVLEFNNKDYSGDLKFLDNLEKIINKVKSAIDRRKKSRRHFSRATKIESFLDFIQEVINILNGYDDKAFEEFFSILDQEIRSYHYRGCKFYELTENYEIKKFMATKLDMIKDQSVVVIKTYINVIADMIKNDNFNNPVKELVIYINSLYSKDTREKFNKILKELDEYGQSKSKRSGTDLVTIVRDGVRTIIFDHYTNLNSNARRELKSKIEALWTQYKQSTSPRTTFKSADDNDNYELDIINNSKDETSRNMGAPHNSSKTKEHKKQEKSMIGAKRIDIKESDYKKTGKLSRIGVEEGKKLIKHNKIETGGHSTTNEKITLTAPNKNVDIYQSTTPEVKYDNNLRTLKSEEGESNGQSLEGKSIESSQKKQREANTKRYITLYPEAYGQAETTPTTTPTSMDSKSIVQRSVQLLSFKPQLQTLWAEESTGGIPQYILEKYTTKSSHKHNSIYDTKYNSKYDSKRDTKHDVKYNIKHESKYDSKIYSKPESKPYIKHDSYRDSQNDKKHDLKDDTIHNVKHGSKYKSKHIPRHEKRQKHHKKNIEHPEVKRPPHHPKQGKPLISKLLPNGNGDERLIQNRGFIDIATAEKPYEYKKIMDPIIDKRAENTEYVSVEATVTMRTVKPTTPSSAVKRFSKATNTPSPQIKTMKHVQHPRVTTRPSKFRYKQLEPIRAKSRVAPVEKIAKRYELLVGKQHRDFRKSVPPAKRNKYKEHSLEQYESKRKQKKDYRKSFTDYNNSTTSVAIDANVIDRLKHLEKALSDVQHKIEAVTNIALKNAYTKHNEYKDKSNYYGRNSKSIHSFTPHYLKRRSRVKLTNSNDKQKQEIKYTKEKEPKLIEPNKVKDLLVTNTTKPPDDVVNITTTPKASYQPTTNTLNNTSNIIETAETNYVYEKRPDPVHDVPQAVKLVEADKISKTEIDLKRHFEDKDVWKGLFNKKIKTNDILGKYLSTSSTVYSETTIKSNATLKSTEMVTTSPRVVFMPESVANTQTTTAAPKVVKNDNNTKSYTNSNVESVQPSNQSRSDNIFTKPNVNTKSTSEVSRVSNVTKPFASSTSVPVTMPTTQQGTTNWRFKELAFTPPDLFGGNDNLINDNDLLTDPFADMGVGMDFLKTL